MGLHGFIPKKLPIDVDVSIASSKIMLRALSVSLFANRKSCLLLQLWQTNMLAAVAAASTILLQ